MSTMMPNRYDFHEAEPRLVQSWLPRELYAFDPHGSGPMYTIDTPPPTVSGELHIGHCFSYTQADVIARFHRMRGERVFFPMGFDDNGLPTERLVEQNPQPQSHRDGASRVPCALSGTDSADGGSLRGPLAASEFER